MPTKNTKIISLRVPNEVDFGGINLHKLVADMFKRYRAGEIKIEDDKVVLPETMGETSVNDCEGCPYINDLDMSKFDEVCEFRGIERQQALDKCVQMLWR